MTSDRRVVFTGEAPRPIGPYSQAIVAPAGRLVFCSGQIALDPATGALRGDTAAEQAEVALDNLEAVLRAAGASFEHVVKTTIYLANLDDFGAVGEVYARRFEGAAPPARATVEVSRLPAGALVEIDAIAVVSAA